MKCKNTVFIFACICSILAIMPLTNAAAAEKPLRIGLAWDQTGGYAPMGKEFYNAANLWKDMVNKAGGIKGHPIEFIAYDGQSDANKSILVVKKLIDADKVHVIAGGINAGQVMAMAPICEEGKTPFLNQGASELIDLNSPVKPYWSFRVNVAGAWEEVMFDMGIGRALKPSAKRLANFYYNTAYGKLMGKLCEYYAPVLGFELVASEKYDHGNPDVGAQISNIIATKPDLVLLNMVEATGALALKQMRERGMNMPFMTNGSISAATLEKAFAKDVYSIPPYIYSGASRADVWSHFPKDSPDYKIMAPIAEAYEKQYGQYGVLPQLGMDSLFVLRDSVERALAEDPKLFDRDLPAVRTALRNQIEKTKNFVAGGGTYTMTADNHNGVHVGSHWAVVHWENGKRVADMELMKKVKLQERPPASFYEAMK
jgi:branched-chain amino acid transport system substrate-binding protein